MAVRTNRPTMSHRIRYKTNESGKSRYELVLYMRNMSLKGNVDWEVD